MCGIMAMGLLYELVYGQCVWGGGGRGVLNPMIS
jgi:hypothetical protein